MHKHKMPKNLDYILSETCYKIRIKKPYNHVLHYNYMSILHKIHKSHTLNDPETLLVLNLLYKELRGKSIQKHKIPKNIEDMLLVDINDQFDSCNSLKNIIFNIIFNNIFNLFEDNGALPEGDEDYIYLMFERSIKQMFKLKEKIEKLQNCITENKISFQYDKERALKYEKTYINN